MGKWILVNYQCLVERELNVRFGGEMRGDETKRREMGNKDAVKGLGKWWLTSEAPLAHKRSMLQGSCRSTAVGMRRRGRGSR